MLETIGKNRRFKEFLDSMAKVADLFLIITDEQGNPIIFSNPAPQCKTFVSNLELISPDCSAFLKDISHVEERELITSCPCGYTLYLARFSSLNNEVKGFIICGDFKADTNKKALQVKAQYIKKIIGQVIQNYCDREKGIWSLVFKNTYELTRLFSLAKHLDTLIEFIVDSILILYEPDLCFLCIREGEKVKLTKAKGDIYLGLKEKQWPLTLPFLTNTFLHIEPFVANMSEVQKFLGIDINKQYRCYLFPLWGTMGPLGLVGVISKEFDDEKLKGIEVIANFTGFALNHFVLRNIEKKNILKTYGKLEQWFEQIINLIPLGVTVLTKTPKGLVKSLVSPNIELLTGYKVEEVFEPYWWKNHIHPDDIKIIQEREELFQQGGSIEYRLRKKDGNYIWLYEQINPTFDKKGNLQNIFIAWMDITDRKLIENQLNELSRKTQNYFFQAVDMLGTVVELRDPYTAGHQKRVSELSLSIARKMNLSEELQKKIKIAGFIHDIGKIYIPAEILTKPTSLSPIEFELIRTHSTIGWDILNKFEAFSEIAQAVYQHHERLDGSGYPRGLKGNEICIEAKIIGVADVIEAMMNHRPYRLALGLEKALEEITRHKGRLYDEKIVDICVELFTKDGFRFSY